MTRISLPTGVLFLSLLTACNSQSDSTTAPLSGSNQSTQASSSSSSAPASTPSADAQKILTKIGATNCVQSVDGFQCFVEIPPRLVGIIFSVNYQSVGKCLVHFHGFRERPEDVDDRGTIEWFDFDRALNLGSPNTLMIAPIGLYGADNYSLGTDYGTLAKLTALLNSAEGLSGETCNSLTLSGHSGAYEVLTPLVEGINSTPSDPVAAKVSTLFFFDALYSSNIEPFIDWLAVSSKHRAYNVSLPGGSTEENADDIPAQPGYVNEVSTIDDHWELVRDKYFQEFLTETENLPQ